MLDINKYRLNLYELLYKQPLCNFKIAKDGMDKMKVLFIGDKDKAIETYKTMFLGIAISELQTGNDILR